MLIQAFALVIFGGLALLVGLLLLQLEAWVGLVTFGIGLALVGLGVDLTGGVLAAWIILPAAAILVTAGLALRLSDTDWVGEG